MPEFSGGGTRDRISHLTGSAPVKQRRSGRPGALLFPRLPTSTLPPVILAIVIPVAALVGTGMTGPIKALDCIADEW